MLSEIEREVILSQIQALNARSKAIQAKVESGQELTDDERRELGALADRIGGFLRQLQEQ